jgi:predicted dehydrogenase
VAVCDLREEAAGIRMIYTDPLRMLKEASIEAVDICTTPNHHAELAIAAAGMGKHVLVEKPMVSSLQQCRAMVQAAEQCGVMLMVAQNQRYDPVYQGVR